ncbi:MAG: leucyl/phenylalanyl-tRNA--protein transferase [Verrucomicrobiota bacterium]
MVWVMIPLDFLLEAYKEGVFPMAEPDGRLLWFSPDPRGVIPLDSFYQPHGLRRVVKSGKFEIRVNTSFREVMEGCARRDETWIDSGILETYCALYQEGYAHSVEAWYEGRLAGGLYGVALGGAFFGESMYHDVTDASKVALVALVERLKERGFGLLDLQWVTPHLRQFGAEEIPRRRYLAQLKVEVGRKCQFFP